MTFVDTNYFLRFLINSNNRQHIITKELFLKAAQGKENLITSTIVYFEIYWVLSSFYGKQKKELVKILKNILKMDFIIFKEKDILQEAISIFADSNLDLEDSYNLSYINKYQIENLNTFDENLYKCFNLKKRK